MASLLALDPPHHIYEGVRHYAQAMKRARSEAMRLAEEKRKRASQMNGHRSGSNGGSV